MRSFLSFLSVVILALLVAGSATSRPTVYRGEDVVARLTSKYEPGQPRVINIRRAATLLDGTVIPAGGRFSMNQALGRRTIARGFVPAPQISGGR